MTVAERLVDSHRQFLSFLEKRVGDRAVAEDILQEAFVKSVQRGKELRDETSAIAWFYRLLRNAIVDHYRRSATRHRALELLARDMEHAVAPESDLRGAICACVSRLAATLKPEYATALQRVEIDEVPLSAFAAEADITPNNAAVRLFRARQALKKRVSEACGTCAEHGCIDCHCKRQGLR